MQEELLSERHHIIDDTPKDTANVERNTETELDDILIHKPLEIHKPHERRPRYAA
jgi:hypothetical protein